jgi:peptide/nickel transport system permease protein
VDSAGSAWSRLIANRAARWSLAAIGALVVSAILGPLLVNHSCIEQLDIVRLKNTPPSLSHPFGTDKYARDVLARVLCGGRISLAISVLAVVMSTTIGAAYGLLAGYVGGRLDNVMMRLLDAFMSIPRVLILIAVLTFWTHIPLSQLIILLGVTGWFTVSRLVRAETRLAKTADYVASARALGASDVRIMLRHLLPNVAAPIIVSSTLAVGNVIALEAGLSFLGIGASPPTASWGSIFYDGMDTFSTAWWVVLFPGLAIVITVLAFNALGDALRDVLDPRQLDVDRPLPDTTIELAPTAAATRQLAQNG